MFSLITKDHTQAHTDIKDNEDGTKRQVAYIIHLAKDWKPSFGGDLVQMTPTAHIFPIFNAITIFPVTHSGFHLVTPVSDQAKYPKFQRLALSGWFMSEHTEDLDETEELGKNQEESYGYWHLNGLSGLKLPQVNQLSYKQFKKFRKIKTKARQRKKKKMCQVRWNEKKGYFACEETAL